MITLGITNPPVEIELLDDWSLTFKTEQGTTGAGTDLPFEYSNYDTAVAAPLTTGLTVTTAKETLTGTSAEITGTLDGIGVRDATYQFEFRNANMIPADGRIVITVPSGVTIPDDDVTFFSYDCTLGCDDTNPGSLVWSSGDRELTMIGAFSEYLDSGNIIKFTITGWQNPADSQIAEFFISTIFIDSSDCIDGCAIEDFEGFEIQA